MVARATEPFDRNPKKNWRERLNLSIVLSFSVGIPILVASLTAGYFALQVLYQNKMMDTWAIMFLELEHQGLVLGDELRQTLGHSPKTDGELLLNADDATFDIVKGDFPRPLRLQDFGFDSSFFSAPLPKLTALEVEGVRYLGKLENAGSSLSDGVRPLLKLWRLNPQIFAKILGIGPSVGGSIYLVTRQGRVIHTTDPGITIANVAGRPLVQKFIRSPLTQGQLSLTSDAGVAMYGFFYEIPETNIIMFSEVEKDRIVASIYRIARQFLLVLSGILIGTLLLIQFPLRRIISPLREMAHLAARLGQGDFKLRMATEGFGELKILSRAFTGMTESLLARDEAIRRLLVEQSTKVRLEGELEIARNIQHNLLPSGKLSPDSGLDIGASYLPAGECAGDWYSFSFNPLLKETVIVIVDVSGHGAGSSMFTSMIAGLFDQYTDAKDELFPIEEFASKMNAVLFRLGKGKWHATMMVARYIAGSGTIQVLFGGHTPGFMHAGQGINQEPGMGLKIQKASQPLGISLDFQVVLGSYDFPSGSKLLLYTDGLTEARNQAGKMWGTKSLREIFVSNRGRSVNQTMEAVLREWQEFRRGQVLGDDACLVILRAA
jgi:serine phosphatase RsbU (regulator of sigma subunit)